MRKRQTMTQRITWLPFVSFVLSVLYLPLSHVLAKAAEPTAALPVVDSRTSTTTNWVGTDHTERGSPNSITKLVVPGPCEKERTDVRDLIDFAKMQGAGISTYVSEFNKIEDQVRRNESATTIYHAVESLQHNVEDQILRARALQTQQQVLPNEPQRQSMLPVKLRQYQDRPKGFKLELNSRGQYKGRRDATLHGGYGNPPRGWQSRSSAERLHHAEIKGQRF